MLKDRKSTMLIVKKKLLNLTHQWLENKKKNKIFKICPNHKKILILNTLIQKMNFFQKLIRCYQILNNYKMPTFKTISWIEFKKNNKFLK